MDNRSGSVIFMFLILIKGHDVVIEEPRWPCQIASPITLFVPACGRTPSPSGADLAWTGRTGIVL